MWFKLGAEKVLSKEKLLASPKLIKPKQTTKSSKTNVKNDTRIFELSLTIIQPRVDASNNNLTKEVSNKNNDACY